MTNLYVYEARYVNRNTKVLKTFLNGGIHKNFRFKTFFSFT